MTTLLSLLVVACGPPEAPPPEATPPADWSRVALTPDAFVQVHADAPSVLYFEALPERGECELKPRLAPGPDAAPDARVIEVNLWRPAALNVGIWEVELRPSENCVGDALVRAELLPLAPSNPPGPIRPPEARMIACTGTRPCEFLVLGQPDTLLAVQLARVYGDAEPKPVLEGADGEPLNPRWTTGSGGSSLMWFDGFQGERTLRLAIDPWTTGVWWLNAEAHPPPRDIEASVVLVPYGVQEGSATDAMNRSLQTGLGVDLRPPPQDAAQDAEFDRALLEAIATW